MNKFLLLFIVFLASNAFIYSQTTPPIDDFQFWNETTISFPVVKTRIADGRTIEKLDFFLNGNLRVGRNVSHPIDERIGFGFEFYANKYLTLTHSYLYRAGQPYKGREEYEHRIRFDSALGKKWSNFSLRDRNRLEYRIRNSRADSVRYRNKIQLSIPIQNKDKEIFVPFVATEPFYDFQEKKWTRNEFSAGIGKRFTDYFSADFFYLRQNNRADFLKTINAFGANIKIKID